MCGRVMAPFFIHVYNYHLAHTAILYHPLPQFFLICFYFCDTHRVTGRKKYYILKMTWSAELKYRAIIKRARPDDHDSFMDGQSSVASFNWEDYVEGSDMFKYAFRQTVLVKSSTSATYIPSALLIGSRLPTNPTNPDQVIALAEDSTIQDVQLVARINLEFLCHSYGVESKDEHLDNEIATNFAGVISFIEYSDNNLVERLLSKKTDLWAEHKIDLHEKIKHLLQQPVFMDIVTFNNELLYEYQIEAAKIMPVSSTFPSEFYGGEVIAIGGYSSLDGYTPVNMTIRKDGKDYNW